MKIHIITVGKLKEKYLRDGCAEYLKRLTAFCKTDIVEIAEEQMPESPSAKEIELTLQKEGARILKAVRDNCVCIVLDVAAQQKSSEQFSELLSRYALNGKSEIAIVIGGAFGLSDAVRARAELLLSFSSMTFTHQMMRVLLLEQLYRAFKIARNEKYHL